jgi:hypothetical protein
MVMPGTFVLYFMSGNLKLLLLKPDFFQQLRINLLFSVVVIHFGGDVGRRCG